MSFEDPDAVSEKPRRNLPKIVNFPPPVPNIALTSTEQRVYLQLSLEFSLILDDAPSFQMGSYEWNLILPSRLQSYAITEDAWERLSSIGDECDELQEQISKLTEEFS
jgi:hypothetical protein